MIKKFLERNKFAIFFIQNNTLTFTFSQSPRGEKRSVDQVDADSDEETPVNDEVRLWESGFKDRYYESKFDVSSDNIGFRQKVALEYVRGLCWVLCYYYQVGVCPSFRPNTIPGSVNELRCSIFRGVRPGNGIIPIITRRLPPISSTLLLILSFLKKKRKR